MKLGELLEKSQCVISALPDSYYILNVNGLSSDSRYAGEGDLFFARKGLKTHGLDYLNELEKSKVTVIFYEAGYEGRLSENIPCIQVLNIDEMLPKIAKAFHESLLKTLSLIGITGTEGKTSVSQFTAQALTLLNQPCGVIGTNGIGLLGDLKENTHTTPDLLSIYSSLAKIHNLLKEYSFKPVSIEVTSHALDQKRIEYLSFDVTTFTNLARDHLDYHETVDAYAQAKKRLFYDYYSKASVINIDDALGEEIFTQLVTLKNRVLYPFGAKLCDFPNYLRISDLVLDLEGIQFTLTYHDKNHRVSSSLYGHFNAHNLVAMIGNLLALGYSIEEIISIIPKICNVEGRVEQVKVATGAVGIIDYAHKPNALLQVLKALHQHISTGEIYCIFGCGGDRDRGKRPLMGGIAVEHAHHVIITNDNPRTEDPAFIAEEILAGCAGSEKVKVILDRKTAIYDALSRAKEGDLILIAGKGHETYQIVGNKKSHFSDIEIIHEFNKNRET